MDGLPTAEKFENDRTKCFFCEKKKETTKHIFAECHIIKSLFNKVRENIITDDQERSFDVISKNIHLNEKEIILFSKLKLFIWSTRNILKYDKKILNLEKFLHINLKFYTDNDHG